MIRGPLRVLGVMIAIIVLLVFTIITWTDVGTEQVEVDTAAKGLTSITWAGRVASDGRLAVEITYDFDDDATHSMDVRLPAGARYLMIDDKAVAADAGLYATANVSGQATVSYELPSVVTRYRDGSLLQLATVTDTTLDSKRMMFVCPRCYIDGVGYGDTPVYGVLHVAGAEETALQFIGLSSIRAEADADEIRFVGIDVGTDNVAMLARLSAEATPALTVRDGTIADALRSAQDALKPTGEKLQAPTVPEAGSAWWPIGLGALAVLLVVWLEMSRRTARRARGL